MKKILTGLVLLVLAAVAAVILSRWRGGDAPPAAPAFTVPGTPAAVYDAILPEVRDRIARDTKVVRIDSVNGAVTMRFTAYLEDHSVRLIEVGLAPAPAGATTVSVASRRFSFLPGLGRDAQDATLEASLVRLIDRRTRPQDSPGSPGESSRRPGSE